MFAGTWTLIKLILRRDRIKLPIWILSAAGFAVLMVPLLVKTTGSAASLAELATSMQLNDVVKLLTGPLDQATLGGLFLVKTSLYTALILAFFNTLLVIRHTRQNEELGAQELILSGRASRYSPLLAVLTVALVSNILITALMGLGIATIANEWPVGQSWLYALSMGGLGLAFAAIASIVAQLTETSSAANGILAGVIGATFLLRGAGDVLGTVVAGVPTPAFWSYLSPFGWMQLTHSTTFGYWWPLLIPLVFCLAAVPCAFWLLARRDLGAGLLPGRRGRARASRLLRTPFGLTWHLQKNVFMGWLVGNLVLVVVIGSMSNQMDKVYSASSQLKDFIISLGGSGAIEKAFLSAMLTYVAALTLAYVIQSLGKLRSEEVSSHLENLLATKLSRIKWLALHVATALTGGAAMLALSGAVLAISVNVAGGGSADIWAYTCGALSYWPLLLVFTGVYVLLFGILPMAASLVAWLGLCWVVFVGELAALIGIPNWLRDLSPMVHIHPAPAEAIAAGPLIAMSLIGLALLAVGAISWYRRNLAEQ
ncbi:MAG: hypothetical protein LBG75_00855 [Candidatus Nomurabacteria bacterium]|jgi:ABC-2 type transport system permease protein|nr:hypothetical protein [Candidatus Nomurabacteria bacterium]